MSQLFAMKSRLVDYLHRMESTPFIWGETDCCHFVAGAAEVMTGKRVVDASECDGLVGALREFLGANRDVGVLADRYFKRIDNASVSYGDIVAVKVQTPVSEKLFGDVCLGLFLGEKIAVKSKDGVLYVPPVFIAAWSID